MKQENRVKISTFEEYCARSRAYQKLVTEATTWAERVSKYRLQGDTTRAKTTTLNARWADAAERRDTYRRLLLEEFNNLQT